MPFSILSTCSSCGTENRVPAAHLADTGRCGKCKNPLAPVDYPIEVDSVGFAEIVSTSKVPVLVDFWAEWCGPCKMAAPEVHALAQEMAGQAVVLKVDTDANQRLAGQYGIQSIPNFLVFRQGRPVFQKAGVAPRGDMRRWLKQD